MKFNDVKMGMVFTIGETPSYPKLKTEVGYIDIRDEIVNNSPNGAVLGSECRELSALEVAQIFEDNEESIQKWFDETRDKFLPEFNKKDNI